MHAHLGRVHPHAGHTKRLETERAAGVLHPRGTSKAPCLWPAESSGQREPEQVVPVVTDRAGLPDTGQSGPRGLIQRLAYLSAAAQVVRAAAAALLAPPCVTLARSEVPREERESEDRGRFPDISHHARAGLTRNERQEPLSRVSYAGRRPAGRRPIVGGVIIPGPCALSHPDPVAPMRRAHDLCLKIYYTALSGITKHRMRIASAIILLP